MRIATLLVLLLTACSGAAYEKPFTFGGASAVVDSEGTVDVEGKGELFGIPVTVTVGEDGETCFNVAMLRKCFKLGDLLGVDDGD